MIYDQWAIDKYGERIYVGDKVICIWPVKGGGRHQLDIVVPHGTECTVEEIVKTNHRDNPFYIKIKDLKDSFGYDLETPRRPIYTGRRFMRTGQNDIVGLIENL